jgi:hypothetical protein
VSTEDSYVEILTLVLQNVSVFEHRVYFQKIVKEGNQAGNACGVTGVSQNHRNLGCNEPEELSLLLLRYSL